MKQMTDLELVDTKGGFSVMAGAVIVAALIFIIGVIDGIVHPKKCNE